MMETYPTRRPIWRSFSCNRCLWFSRSLLRHEVSCAQLVRRCPSEVWSLGWVARTSVIDDSRWCGWMQYWGEYWKQTAVQHLLQIQLIYIYIYIYPRNMAPVVGDYVPSLSLSKYGVSGGSGIYKWYYVVIIQIWVTAKNKKPQPSQS